MDADVTFGDGHFDNAAADFVRLQHLITPVTTALLGHLPPLEPDALVVDLACGAGEPGLTLARELPEVQVLGIDSSQNMIATARETAGREKVSNIRFEMSSVEDVDVAEGVADAVVSRFGALLFGDPAAASRQVARILKPRGAFSIAVWEDSASNTFFRLASRALGGHASQVLSVSEQLDRLAASGRRETWLREAGLGQVDSELFHWDYRFADGAAAWAMVVSKAMLGSVVEHLSPDDVADAQQAFYDAMESFRAAESDGYAVPQTCRLIWGSK